MTIPGDEDLNTPEPESSALVDAMGGAALPMDPRTRSMVDVLYRQHAGFVQKKLARRDIGPASARDLHQQVFVTLGQQIQKQGLLNKPEAMLTTIAEHKILNYLRQKKRRPTFAAETEAEALSESVSKADVEQLARTRECGRIVDELLRKLDAEEGALIARIDLEGMTHAEAAGLFNRRLSTLRTQHRRAHEKLKALSRRLDTSLSR
jgi:RNA polymerase sigma factor (sigma-70 family)